MYEFLITELGCFLSTEHSRLITISLEDILVQPESRFSC